MAARRGACRPAMIAVVLLSVILGCGAHAGPKVTLIGDYHGSAIMQEVAGAEASEIRRTGEVNVLESVSAGVTLRSLVATAGVTAMADLLQLTDIALIVMDATVGPTPLMREHVLIARQARVPMLAILVTNVAQVYASAPEESAELIAIEIQEVRDLLTTYDLDGGAVGAYYDASVPSPVTGVEAFGNRESLRSLARFAPRRVRAAHAEKARDIWGAVYLLTELESPGAAVSLTPRDTLVVWSEGTQSKASLNSLSEYHPGDFREMRLTLESGVRGTLGSRILLVSGERVVGLGAITQIGH
jgi:hypothetical protein